MRLLLTATFSFFTFFSFSQTDSAQFYLKKGLDEKAKGRLMESFKHFDKAYSYDQKDREIVSELANTLYELRRYPQAREKYMQLEKMGDASAATYKQLMLLSFNMRQQNDAIRYAQLLKKADPSEKVAFYIGKAYYDQENYGEAIKNLDMAAKENPQNAEVKYLIARAYADMQNFKQAIPYFEKAITLEPENNRWLYELGLIYYGMQDDKNSLKYLLLAGEKGYKKDNEYLQNLAVAYLNSGQANKGLDILKEALVRRPSDMNLLSIIAEACYDAKKYDDAIDYWDQILSLDKKNAEALYMIGMSYQKKGERQKGMALCDKAIEMDPSLQRNKQKMQMPGM
ncbi:MAG: tetratricopeptide repeat protein [Flavisolibacter sp.]|nr:tetratricopeptide repeat protein [Flavisolibacter sp.]